MGKVRPWLKASLGYICRVPPGHPGYESLSEKKKVKKPTWFLWYLIDLENKIKLHFIVFDCLKVPSACRAYSHQKRGLEPLELELQDNVMSCLAGAELPPPPFCFVSRRGLIHLWLTRNCRPACLQLRDSPAGYRTWEFEKFYRENFLLLVFWERILLSTG